MTYDYDTLIVGAGPAGCAAGYDLAQAGKHVILLDKRSFPRHKACACGLTRKTLKALRYSVDPIVERVCHEIVLQTSDTPGAPGPAFGTRVPTNLPVADKSREVRVRARNPICAMAVRERFDEFCLHQTLASAANGGSIALRKIDTILALREHSTHIELDIATVDGPRTLTAPVLIGADGSNGQTRRLTRQDSHGEAPSPSAQDGFALEATVPYTDLPAQLPSGDNPTDLVFDFAPLPGGYGWLFPKGDHINIGVGAFAPKGGSGGPSMTASSSWVGSHEARLKSVTRQLLLTYAHQKLGVTELAHITGQQLGMGGHTYIPRGRVLLTGDAAGLVDPLTGEGIHSAIVSGQAAASAILEVLNAPANKLSSRPEARSLRRSGETPVSPASSAGTAFPVNTIAAAYALYLRPLQQTLTFSHRAARAFYADPNRGFKAMRYPFMRSLILKTYADGLPHTKLLTILAKLLT